MDKLTDIYNGWKNLLFPTPEIEALAKERIKICVNCELLNNKNFCKLCGCYMPAKVRNKNSKCKIKKW